MDRSRTFPRRSARITAWEGTGVETELAATRRKEPRGSCSLGGPGYGPIMERTIQSATGTQWKVIGNG